MVIGRRLLQLFEAVCTVCGDHRCGHQDHAGTLPWTLQWEAFFTAEHTAYPRTIAPSVEDV